MERRELATRDPDARALAPLLKLLLLLGMSGGLLYLTAGPPGLPGPLPDRERIVRTFLGYDFPLEAVAALAVTGAWVLWVWLMGTLLLRVFVGVAERVTDGATWVRPLRLLSDGLTLPLVRGAVDAALAAAMVAQVAGRAAPAFAGPMVPLTEQVAFVGEHRVTSGERPVASVLQAEETAETAELEDDRSVAYSVQAGDTLWGIARRFYGAGEEFPRLVEANVGRRMTDGRTFDRQAVIHPGWVLRVALPSQALEEDARGRVYIVEPGDTLSGVAARLLGDEGRWEELFRINRGTARLPDGRTLEDPDLIWPGLRLRLPDDATRTERHGTPPAGTLDPTSASSAPVPREPPSVEGDSVPPTPNGETRLAPASDVEPTRAAPARSEQALPLAGAGLGAAAIAGSAIFLTRRRWLLRNLDEQPPPREPENDVAFDAQGFAAADQLPRAFTHRLHGEEAEPVTLVVEQVLRAIEDEGVSQATVVSAIHGRSGTTLTISADLADQVRVVELARRIGKRLGGAGQAWLTRDHDVELRLSGIRRTQLLPPARPSRRSICLLPAGVLPNRRVLYLNWDALGHVLLASLPGEGAHIGLTSLLAALATRRGPRELRVWTFAQTPQLPAALAQLPHQHAGFVEPSPEDVSAVLAEFRAELERRMDEPPGDTLPEWVLVLGDLRSVVPEREGSTTLELLGTHGPAYGLRLLAASTDRAQRNDDLLAHFQTRIVFRTETEHESTQLLGQPDACDLGEGGHLLLRLDGRETVRARGLRVPDDQLDELVRLMCEAYPGQQSDSRPEPWATGRDGPAPQTAETREPCDQTEDDRDAESASLPLGDGAETETHPRSASDDIDGLVRADPPAARPDDPGRNGHAQDALLVRNVASTRSFAAARPMESSTPGKPRLDVQCFGGFVVRSAGRELEPYLAVGGQRKATYAGWEVLAYLCVHEPGSVTKERLMEALYPDCDEKQAANRLYVALSRLRQALKEQVPGLSRAEISIDRDGLCRLDSEVIVSDVHQFLGLIKVASKEAPERAEGTLERARRLYGGDLLSGPGARYYGWLYEHDLGGVLLQDHYRQHYLRATRDLARRYSGTGDESRAVELYREILCAEPTAEDVVRELYRSYEQLGDLGALVREEQRLRQALRDAWAASEEPDDGEVGRAHDDPSYCTPEHETTALFEHIRAALEGASRRKAAPRERTAAAAD